MKFHIGASSTFLIFLDFKLLPCCECCILLLDDSPALNFIYQCFGRSETSADEVQTPGNHPKERIQSPILLNGG